MNDSSIGIFDSGVGGLTVVREVMKRLPNENVVYFGDTLRVPYGNRSKDELAQFTRQNIEFLESKNVKAIVIACNTVSANCMPEIAAEFSLPIIEVLSPGVEVAALVAENNVGVIATEAAIRSGAHKLLFEKENPRLNVYTKACPLLVPLVEEGLGETAVADAAANWYLRELSEKGIDTLLMGCTHYPLLERAIKKALGENVRLIDPAAATVEKLAALLKERQIENEGGAGELHFYVSGDPEKFRALSGIILNMGTNEEVLAWNLQK